MEAAFAATTAVDVVEHYPGTASTDFWGISFAFSGIDRLRALTGTPCRATHWSMN
jgi:hypothetical protein